MSQLKPYPKPQMFLQRQSYGVLNHMRESQDLIEAWRALPPGTELVLATVVATRGSVYRRAGARILLTRDRWLAGSISGGCIESDLTQSAFERTESGPVMVTYDASAPDDVLLGFGLGCNGATDVLMQRLPEDGGILAAIEEVLTTRVPAKLALYVDGSWRVNSPSTDGALLTETISPLPSLVVFGAGNDTVPLVKIAKQVGFHVSVFDGRSAYASSERFPEVDVIRVVAPGEKIDLEPNASVVLMTHSFAHDTAVLKWLPKDLPYVGVLGPSYRTQRLLDELGIEGSHLYSPIGLDLGAEGPEEIALAILAEILAVRKDRSAGHLKGRKAPLHAKEVGTHVGCLR